jgi:hypothetical protein
MIDFSKEGLKEKAKRIKIELDRLRSDYDETTDNDGGVRRGILTAKITRLQEHLKFLTGEDY